MFSLMMNMILTNTANSDLSQKHFPERPRFAERNTSLFQNNAPLEIRYTEKYTRKSSNDLRVLFLHGSAGDD